MKFYIFGSEKDTFTTTSRKALGEFEDLDEALAKFEKCIREIRENNIYLIVDFEVYGKFNMFATSNIDEDYADNLPFFIIGEWHVGDDPKMYVRTDHTVLTYGGFNHEFDNNINALRLFINYYNSGRDCEFDIVYSKIKKLDTGNYKSVFRRKIAKSSVLYNIEKSGVYRPINKFKIHTPNWDKVESTPRIFYNYFLNNSKKEVEVAVPSPTVMIAK